MKVCIDEFGRLNVCESGYVVYECPEELNCGENCGEYKNKLENLKNKLKKALEKKPENKKTEKDEEELLKLPVKMMEVEKLLICCMLREVVR